MQSSEGFHPIDKYSWVVSALRIDWFAELAEGKVGDVSGSLVYLLVLAALAVGLYQKARSSVQQTGIFGLMR